MISSTAAFVSLMYLGPQGSTGIGPCGPNTHNGPSARLPINLATIASSKMCQFSIQGSTHTGHGMEEIPFATTVISEGPSSINQGTTNCVELIADPVATPIEE